MELLQHMSWRAQCAMVREGGTRSTSCSWMIDRDPDSGPPLEEIKTLPAEAGGASGGLAGAQMATKVTNAISASLCILLRYMRSSA